MYVCNDHLGFAGLLRSKCFASVPDYSNHPLKFPLLKKNSAGVIVDKNYRKSYEMCRNYVNLVNYVTKPSAIRQYS